MGIPIRHSKAQFRERNKGARSGTPSRRAYEVAILLFPNFSQVCLSTIVEPLRLANALSRRELFRWRLIGLSGDGVDCAGGITVGVRSDVEAEFAAVRSGIAPDAAIVCAGEAVERFCTSSAVSLFRLYAKRGVTLFGSHTGTWLLAKGGLLAGRRCTIHWKKAVALSRKVRRSHDRNRKLRSRRRLRHVFRRLCSIRHDDRPDRTGMRACEPSVGT